MGELSREEALSLARVTLEQDPDAAATVMRVRRLDRHGANYYLVLLANAAANVDTATGEILSSSRVKAGPLLSAEAAIARAALGSESHVELVWAPCQASLSMFDPLWAVSAERAMVLVDQRGRVWRELPVKMPGG